MKSQEQLREEIETIGWNGTGEEEMDKIMAILDREKRAAIEEFFPRWQKEVWENTTLTTAEQCFDKVINEMFPPTK